MHFKWNYEPPTSERQTAAKELGEKIGMSPILADLLIQRGIKTERSQAILPPDAKRTDRSVPDE